MDITTSGNQVDTTTTPGVPAPMDERFASLLSDREICRPRYDTCLATIDECAVIPTLGSIVPDWLLIVPNMRTINFSKWANTNLRNPASLILRLVEKFGHKIEDVIWFEHGPANGSSYLGCGVDQAHIHVIINPPFTFNAFEEATRFAVSATWHRQVFDRVYQEIKGIRILAWKAVAWCPLTKH